MSAARIIRALLTVATASHRAFSNSEPLADASHARVINDADYSGLTRALFSLAAAVPPVNSEDSAPFRAELALRDTLEKLEAPLAVDLAKLPTLAAWFLAGKLPDDLAWNVTVTADVLREVFPDVLRAELASMRPDQAAAASQVAPASALPSRPDYWNIDTAGAQYDALARDVGVGKLVPREGGGLTWVGAGGALPEGARGGTGGSGPATFQASTEWQTPTPERIVGFVTYGAGGGGGGSGPCPECGLALGQHAFACILAGAGRSGSGGGGVSLRQLEQMSPSARPSVERPVDLAELTPERVERFLGAADDELGPECCDAWVEKCREILRAAAKGGNRGR